ncbi:MAG: hypothetical protein PHX12_12530 [Proteiniphilum sp.]|nr:hypothetical protein [Proteiniphilum sp.]
MTDDLYIQAHKLQKLIDEQEAILKETKAEHAHIIETIRKDGITNPAYEVCPSTTPKREAVPSWFAENSPEMYSKFAHLPHPKAINILSDICGNYMALQKQIRTARPDEFAKFAELNISDIEAEIGKDALRTIADKGGVVYAKPKSYKVVEVPEAIRLINIKNMEKQE